MKVVKSVWIVLLFFFAATMMNNLALYANNSEGGNQDDATTHTPISIIKQTGNDHRTLVQDIEAYHTNNMVYLTFNENLGQANIVITNANTGAQVETSVPTTCSNVQVDISSLGQGDFTILIICEGSSYYGSFHNRTEL